MWAERSRRRAAAVGERRHRDELLPEPGQAAKDLIPVRAKTMVDSQAELILIDRLVAEPPVVVGGAGGDWQRISRQQGSGDRIHPLDGNRASGEWAAGDCAIGAGHRRGRVVNRWCAPTDGFREDALTLQKRGDSGDDRAANHLSLSLIVGEKECVIPSNRTADHATELVAAKLRLDGIGGSEEVSRIQSFVSEELKGDTTNNIAPGLGGQVNDTTIEATELCRRTIALDLELLNRIDVRNKRHLTRLGLKH